MAVQILGHRDKFLKEKLRSCKILVVGAGGIGCELLKNLVLSGFIKIHIIDLDIIELSNLNRQFLFHKQHIGRPKAVVAKESVLKFNPKADITAYHDSITNPHFNAEFFRQFTCVTNALDNVAARSHVNRMCLAADVPLIESGTAGYVGQVTVYKKIITECFECLPRKPPKTYPGCTIRNTPSEPVHCIVWAKHLFNQLFGETDADEEVSPDMADPELKSTPNEAGNISRVSTREWAKSSNYDPLKIFNKLFVEDIEYLNLMTDLWEKRTRPKCLNYNNLPDAALGPTHHEDSRIKDQKLWSIKQCFDIFCNSLTALKKKLEELGENSVLTWDKDDDHCMDFVASCANLRSFCFGIAQKSRFDVKAIAGNIVPAIATTNAVIAGLLVLQLIKVLKGDFTKCKTAWLKETGNGGRIISSSWLEKPNPDCYVCSSQNPEVKIKLNVNTLTMQTLEEKILKEKLHMAQPDVVVDDGTGKILLSSDPEEMTDVMMDKPLSYYGLKSSSRLLCEDFLQHYKIYLTLSPCSECKDQEFTFDTDIENLLSQHKALEEMRENPDVSICETVSDNEEVTVFPSVSASKSPSETPKRKLSEEENGTDVLVGKKRKTDAE